MGARHVGDGDGRFSAETAADRPTTPISSLSRPFFDYKKLEYGPIYAALRSVHAHVCRFVRLVRIMLY